MQTLKKILLTATFTSTMLFASADNLTLDDLIAKALLNSPDLNISKASFDIATQRTNEADANYLPQVDAIGSAGVIGVEQTAPTSVSENGSIIAGTLSASQLIYDFGKTGGNMDAFASDANASFSLYQQAISDKIYYVKEAYYKVLTQQSLISVQEENLKLNEQQLVRSKRYFEAGIRTKIDVSDANVKLIQAKLDLQNVLYDLRTAYVNLDNVIGVIQDTTENHVYTPELKLPYLYNTLPDQNVTIDDLKTFAFTHRQELLSQRQNIEGARNRVRSASGNYYPGLYASGNYQYTKLDDALSASLFTPEQQWQATVDLKWNLFEGFKTDAQTEQAKVTLLQTTSQYEAAKLQVRKETENANIYVFKARDNVKLSESLANAAKEKFDQAQQRYEHGLSDYIELQEARQDYINSLSVLVTNYYDYYIALANLDRVIGR